MAEIRSFRWARSWGIVLLQFGFGANGHGGPDLADPIENQTLPPGCVLNASCPDR